jgi:hypothetical protein
MLTAGVPITIAGSGFPANAALVFYVIDPTGTVVEDPTARGDITVTATGTFQLTITPPEEASAGRYTIIVAESATGPELARATLTLTPLRGETFIVTPTAGPAGTRFVVTGTGYTPNASLLVAAFSNRSDDPAAPPVRVTIGADGQLRATIDSTGFAPGEYFALVTPSENESPIAIATFTVTGAATASPTAPAATPATPSPAAPTAAPVRTPTPTPAPMPGLPNTEGRYDGGVPGTPLPAALLLLALLAVGGLALRRYVRYN